MSSFNYTCTSYTDLLTFSPCSHFRQWIEHCPFFQEPQLSSLAPAAAVLTIPLPTSSPWGVLPSPWPHLWSSPATPCITAAKTKTSLRPLQPPRPRMTDSLPLPMETPPQTDPPTTAKTNIPKPVLCWHFFSLHHCHSKHYMNYQTLVSVQTLSC